MNYAADAFEIADADGIRGNIVLPEEGLYGVKIAWASSDESVITSKGKVTRGESGKKAVLTAALTLGELTAERQFEVTVLPKEEDAAYLFAYFTGNSASQERLFYGVSRDGYNFKALNGGESELNALFEAYGEVELVEPEYTLKFVSDTTAGFAAKAGAWAIAAVYNENGELESVVTEEVSDYKEIEFAQQEGGWVKIMLWSEGEKPLCKAKTKKYD